MLLSPAPANVALRAIHGEGAPTGRRKIHQRTAFRPRDTRFTTAARSRTDRFASLMLAHVVPQLTFRANKTSAAMIAALRSSRKIREAAFFTRRRRGVRSDNPGPTNDQ